MLSTVRRPVSGTLTDAADTQHRHKHGCQQQPGDAGTGVPIAIVLRCRAVPGRGTALFRRSADFMSAVSTALILSVAMTAGPGGAQ